MTDCLTESQGQWKATTMAASSLRNMLACVSYAVAIAGIIKYLKTASEPVVSRFDGSKELISCKSNLLPGLKAGHRVDTFWFGGKPWVSVSGTPNFLYVEDGGRNAC